MAPSEAPILSTRIMPTSMRPPPEPRPLSSHPVSIAPLAPVPIEALSPEVTPNEAPPPPEVPPEVTLASPIEALPMFDPNSDPVPRIQVPAVPAVALNIVEPSSTSESTCSPSPLGKPVCEPTEAVAPRPTYPESSGDARADLARLVQRSVKAYKSTTTWGEFVAQCRDSTGDFHPEVKHLPHRAAHLIDTLRRSGATVGMKTEPWSRQRKEEALQ
jgi:hypothetical protein